MTCLLTSVITAQLTTLFYWIRYIEVQISLVSAQWVNCCGVRLSLPVGCPSLPG